MYVVFTLFYPTSQKILIGHASNTTFTIFSLSALGGKRYVGPPFRLLGGARAGLPPPGSTSVYGRMPPPAECIGIWENAYLNCSLCDINNILWPKTYPISFSYATCTYGAVLLFHTWWLWLHTSRTEDGFIVMNFQIEWKASWPSLTQYVTLTSLAWP